MQVTRIGTASDMPDGFMTALGDLIEVVGRPSFDKKLFQIAHAATGCVQIAVFTSTADEAPQAVVEEGLGTVPAHLNAKYTSNYWRVDPARAVEAGQQNSDTSLAIIDANELSSSYYRDECYVGANLRSRATVCRRRSGRSMHFNLYFNDRRAFDYDVINYLGRTADLMDMLLRRHGCRETCAPPRLDAGDIQRRLNLVAPELSARELQVCTHIARGLTSEGIALELGISINTVLTYRKRAYGRLNITTQNELLHRLVA